MRNRVMCLFSPARIGALAVALAFAPAVIASAVAEPQAAGVLAPGGYEEASRSRAQSATPAAAGTQGAASAEATARTPKKPEAPMDNTIFAPPLAGYVVMFLLGGAVVMLNLWSSKRTQIE